MIKARKRSISKSRCSSTISLPRSLPGPGRLRFPGDPLGLERRLRHHRFDPGERWEVLSLPDDDPVHSIIRALVQSDTGSARPRFTPPADSASRQPGQSWNFGKLRDLRARNRPASYTARAPERKAGGGSQLTIETRECPHIETK